MIIFHVFTHQLCQGMCDCPQIAVLQLVYGGTDDAIETERRANAIDISFPFLTVPAEHSV
jgi:hypothetical protein